ncbi:hypothetical protein C5167_006654 [Papaver somniferum]|uniref:Uncharacterized protein n=1 Tax=Papaver somniferum TaxID=3469 RepID=A0A4Y7JE06_PAPSO|nr:hypothetical protein C5167_006654 [Papaver somniferum]
MEIFRKIQAYWTSGGEYGLYFRTVGTTGAPHHLGGYPEDRCGNDGWWYVSGKLVGVDARKI